MKKFLNTLQFAAVAAAAMGAGQAFAHVSLAEPAALANGGYKAVFNVGHGCDGAATTALRVQLPPGFRGARPMPKAGWTLDVRRTPLAQPYTSHGKPVTDDVAEITWTAASPANALPDAFFDEFVLRGSLSDKAGPMWFKVLQTCDKAATDWAQVPATGTSTKGLERPAVLLDVIPSEAVGGHQH
jgi:uncharacterized protein YcnI